MRTMHHNTKQTGNAVRRLVLVSQRKRGNANDRSSRLTNIEDRCGPITSNVMFGASRVEWAHPIIERTAVDANTIAIRFDGARCPRRHAVRAAASTTTAARDHAPMSSA